LVFFAVFSPMGGGKQFLELIGENFFHQNSKNAFSEMLGRV
jgi:hypothetical protein